MPLFEKDTTRAIARATGSFWTDIFGGADTIDVIIGASVAEHTQVEKDIEEAILSLSRYKIPLFKEEIWKKFIVEVGDIKEASRLLYKYQSSTAAGITSQTTVRYVTDSAGGGGDGLTLETAWTFAEGIAALATGMQLRIVDGTYTLTASVTLPSTENFEVVGANIHGLIDGTHPVIQTDTGYTLYSVLFNPDGERMNNTVWRHLTFGATRSPRFPSDQRAQGELSF